jgi:hypothetical protein
MRCSLLACGLALLLAPHALAEDTPSPRAVIERAIKAHGGKERLSKARADRVEFKGTLHVGKQEVPFVARTTVQLPDQFKNEMEMTIAGRLHTVVQILDGDKATVLHNGMPQKVSDEVAAEMRATLRLDRAVRLVPLLTDRTFRLKSLGESKVQGRAVWGVEVSLQGTKALSLYFDKESGLLIKSEHRLRTDKDKAVVQEHYYSGFKDIGGYRRPTRVAAYRDGKKLMEARLVKVKTFDHLDAREFRAP